jgi:phage shock protein A
MKVLERVRKIIAANINHLIEKAENPEKMIKQLIRDMDESIINLRLEVAKAIAAEKRLRRRAEEAEKAVKTWEENGETAVKDGNDDLARQAIVKKIDAQKLLDELNHQHEEAAHVSATMKEQLQQLENKIQEARRKKEILIARKHRAEAQKSMIDTAQEFTRVSRRANSLLKYVSSDVPQTLDSLEDSVMELESENEARLELLKESHGIEETLAEARQNEEVEEELAALKKKMEET